jgi:hypothetical protein
MLGSYICAMYFHFYGITMVKGLSNFRPLHCVFAQAGNDNIAELYRHSPQAIRPF